MNVSTRRFLGVIAIAVLVGGCAGGGDEGGGGAPQPTLTWLQQNIFTPICADCHVGANAPHGLLLEAGKMRDNTVNVKSHEAPAFTRIIPGDPDNSYVMIKIVPTDARRIDSRMPANGPPFLSDAQIEAVRQWIKNGAKDD